MVVIGYFVRAVLLDGWNNEEPQKYLAYLQAVSKTLENWAQLGVPAGQRSKTHISADRLISSQSCPQPYYNTVLIICVGVFFIFSQCMYKLDHVLILEDPHNVTLVHQCMHSGKLSFRSIDT